MGFTDIGNSSKACTKFSVSCTYAPPASRKGSGDVHVPQRSRSVKISCDSCLRVGAVARALPAWRSGRAGCVWLRGGVKGAAHWRRLSGSVVSVSLLITTVLLLRLPSPLPGAVQLPSAHGSFAGTAAVSGEQRGILEPSALSPQPSLPRGSRQGRDGTGA